MCKTCKELLISKSTRSYEKDIRFKDVENEYEYVEEIYKPNSKCICGVKIFREQHITNIYTGEIIIIGRNCLSNTFKINANILESIKYKYCDICKKNLKYENYDEHIFSEKHTLIEFYRKCEKCNKYNICKTKPIDYKYCKVCYNKRTNLKLKKCQKLISSNYKYYNYLL